MTATCTPPNIAADGPLTGQALIEKHDALTAEGLSDREIAKACGYASTKQTDEGEREVVATGDMMKALLSAYSGKDFRKRRRGGAPGRQLSYAAKVMKPGNLVLAKGYLRAIGAGFGTEFDIYVGVNGIQVVMAGQEPDFSEVRGPKFDD